MAITNSITPTQDQKTHCSQYSSLTTCHSYAVFSSHGVQIHLLLVNNRFPWSENHPHGLSLTLLIGVHKLIISPGGSFLFAEIHRWPKIPWTVINVVQ